MLVRIEEKSQGCNQWNVSFTVLLIGNECSSIVPEGHAATILLRCVVMLYAIRALLHQYLLMMSQLRRLHSRKKSITLLADAV